MFQNTDTLICFFLTPCIESTTWWFSMVENLTKIVQRGGSTIFWWAYFSTGWQKNTISSRYAVLCLVCFASATVSPKHLSSKLRWSSMMQNIIRSGTQRLHVRSNTMFQPFRKWTASSHFRTFSTTNLYSFCLQKRKKRANKPLESNRVKKTPNYTRHRPHIAWKGIINFPQFVTNWFKIYIVLQRYTGWSISCHLGVV